jgi:hypothetical protein
MGCCKVKGCKHEAVSKGLCTYHSDPMRPSALPPDLRDGSDPMRPSALPKDLISSFNPMAPRYRDLNKK